jgi:hypothetical protein
MKPTNELSLAAPLSLSPNLRSGEISLSGKEKENNLTTQQPEVVL